jgi:Domain of unknown function (DUF4190)
MNTNGEPPASSDWPGGRTSGVPVRRTGQANARTNSFAIVALVLGLVLPPLAVPFGHVARSHIRRTGERGGGMALAGLILGYYSLVGLVILMIAALFGVDLL